MANRQQQPVQVPEYESRTQLSPAPLVGRDDGGGKYFARMEKSFSDLGASVGQLADNAAAEEGKLAGFRDGMDTEFRPSNQPTIRGKNYDAAGIETFRLQMDTRIRTKAAELFDANPDDPQAIVAGMKKINDEEGNTFEQVKPHAAALIGRLQLSYVREASRALQSRVDKEQGEAFKDNVTARFSSLDRAVAGLGLDENADKVVAAELDDLRREVNGAVSRGVTSESAGKKIIASAEATAASARIMGTFDRLPTQAAREKYLDGFNLSYSKSEGDFAKLDPRTASNLQSQMVARLKSESAQGNRAAKAVGQELNSVEAVASNGFQVSSTKMAELNARVASTEDPELSRRFEVTQNALSLTQAGAKMRPDELRATLDSYERNAVQADKGEDAARVHKIGTKLLDTMNKNLKQDQLGWADRVGVIPVPIIDFSKPEAPAQMQDRVTRADAVANYYGTAPVYLRPEERLMLERQTAQGGDAMLMTAKALALGFGDKAPAVMKEVSKNAPILAHVGSLLNDGGSERIAYDVADALKIRGNPDYKLPKWLAGKPSDKIATAQETETRNVYGDAFALAGDTGRAATASGRTAFEARSIRSGFDPLLSTSSDKTAFGRTLQESAGATFDRQDNQYGGVTSLGGWFSFTGQNSYKVLVPRDIRADKFGAVIGALRDDDLKALPVPPRAADGRDYTAADLKRARVVAVPGGYRFALGDPNGADPKYIRGADGNPFVLDFSGLKDRLSPRVPGAYLGAR